MPCERPSRFWFIESLFPTSRKEREKWGTRILDTRLVKGFTLSRRTQKRWGTLWAIIFCEFGDGRKRELADPALCRPPEKQGDHSKRIDESMRQNAYPQVASAQHVSGSENEGRHARVHHPRWALVVVSISEEYGHR
jgi:hypothetical protein